MRSLFVILAFLAIVLSIDASAQMADDFVSTDEDESVDFNVTDNDNVILPQPNTVDLNTSLPGRQSSTTTSEGSYTVNKEGYVSFDPVENFFGMATLEYSMNYGFLGLSVGTATIHVTVNSVNDRPTTKDDVAVTDEDTPITLNILTNDEDVDDGIDPATIVITDQEGGTFVSNAAGEVTFTPSPDFAGNAKAKYTVQDFAGATSNKSDIQIQVRSINDPPITRDDEAVTDEGVPIRIRILDNDSDIDGDIDPSTVEITNETGGTFTANNKGEVNFTPQPGNTTATAYYTVQDDDGFVSKSAKITVTINVLNRPPVATNDIVTMSEDGSPLPINVIANDNDEDGFINPASVVITDMVNGTFVANSSGTVTYTPPANFFGTATAKYTVSDNQKAVSNQATITVTVNAVNDPPSFDAIANQRVLKNAASKVITITGITPGPLESETVTFKATSSAPSIVPNPTVAYNGTASTATLTFKPQANKSGKATITVVATDQGSKEFPRTFEIDVVNVEFTSVPITMAVFGQLYEYSVTVTNVTESLTIVASQKPAWATLIPDGKNKAKLRGTPPANSPITNPVILQVKDGSTVIDQQQFTITINRQPTVTDFEITTEEDIAVPFTVEQFNNAYTDPDNNPLAEVMFTNVPNPEHGTLKLSGATVKVGDRIPVASIPTLTYNPNPNYNGRDTAFWKGSDGYSYSQNDADIFLITTPANDAPVITSIESEPIQYELGSEWPIKLTSGITISDPDDVNLSSAEVRFFNFLNYEPDKELLIFRDTLNIRGEFKPDAGILILSGNSSVANYQAALRAVRYNYINLEKVNLRTTDVYITLSDGDNISTPKSRAIELIYTFKHLDIPSAFSPNGDLTNEAWVIRSPNTTDGTVPYKEALIRVYNKRGLLVYEAKGFEHPWDGTLAGKDLPVDTYYYTIDLKYNRVRYKGVVTILR